MSRVKRYSALGLVGLVGVFCLFVPSTVAAATPTLAVPTSLSIAEIKITGNEFILLENNSGAAIPDLSAYWLEDYNNVNPLASGVSNSSQQLPVGSLAAGQTMLLSGGGETCGAAMMSKLSISLTDSGGFLQLVQTSLNPSGTVEQTPVDSISWSSSSNGTIQNVPSSTKDPAGAFYRYQTCTNPSTYGWQTADVDTTNSCQLNVVASGSTTPVQANPGNQLLAGTPPPVTVLGTTATAAGGPSLPASDTGLMAPELNEMVQD